MMKTIREVQFRAVFQAGLYACSPMGKEQEVRFDFLTLEELSDNPNEAYL